MYCLRKQITLIAHRIGCSCDMHSNLRSRSYSVTFEQLKSRSILRLQGVDSESFLQGLITNDVNRFDLGDKSLYAMFLNASGRVLYDSLIYRVASKNDFLIECDRSVVESLRNHMNLFRVRKKVQISIPEYLVWAAFSTENNTNEENLPCAVIKPDDKIIAVCEDPRSKLLGYRLIVDKGVNEEYIKEKFLPFNNFDNSVSYLEHRCIVGVGEGVVEFPQGKCFPMECNCDYMHGISFDKGCYIGQELTARTYHTGVIRKRLMPLIFEASTDHNLREGVEINSIDGAVVGKLRRMIGRVGLGLLRVEKVLDNQRLVIQDKYFCAAFRPSWWPEERKKNV